MTEAFYGLQTDEVTDSVNWKEFAITVRHLKMGSQRKIVLQFLESDSITGAHISTKILQFLRVQIFPAYFFRIQTYDGAGNIAGRLDGCAAHFRNSFFRQIILLH